MVHNKNVSAIIVDMPLRHIVSIRLIYELVRNTENISVL